MPTLTDLAIELFGRGGTIDGVRASSVGATSGSSTIRYGVAQADSAGGRVYVLVDGNVGENYLWAECKTPVSKGQRVSIMYQNGRYEVIALEDVAQQAASAGGTPDMEYALGDSPTEPPESGWTTGAQLPGDGQYLWQRLTLRMADGTVRHGTPQVVAAGGDQGGKTLVAVRETYYLSTSATEQVGGEWTYSQPAWVEGRHIWVRTELSWSDGSYTYSETYLAAALNQAFAQYKVLSARLQENIDNVTIAIQSVARQAQVGADLDRDVRGFFQFGANSAGDPLLTIGASNSAMTSELTNRAQQYKYAGVAVLTIDGEHGRIDTPKLKLGGYELRGDGDGLQLVYVGTS